MFSSVVAALALAASVSRVAASPINHVARGYAQDADLLEDYTPYHVRYLALDCQDKHNTEFFDQCCHPLLRWQKLSERPAQCIPSPSASASAAIAEPSAAPIDEDPLPAADECDDDEDEEECEDEVTSTVPASTAKPTPTRKTATVASAMITSYVAPTPEPTSAPVTTTHRPSSTHPVASAAPVTSAAPSNGGGELFKGGFATFFEQGGVAGACGDKHSDNDLVVAADFRRYGPLNAKSDLCGKKVRITNTDNGKTVVAIIADACPTCVSKNSLDLSHGAYDKIGARETGMLPIEWQFI